MRRIQPKKNYRKAKPSATAPLASRQPVSPEPARLRPSALRDLGKRAGFKRSRASDKAERGALIARYAPLVKLLANRMAMRLPPSVSVDDLISAGIMGLLDAIEKFDPSKEVQFKTYAEFRIRGAILDELRSMDWIPRSIRKKVREMEQAIIAVERKLRRPAEDSEIAGHMGVDLDTYYDMLDKARGVDLLSFDEYVDSHKDNFESKKSFKSLIRGDYDPIDHIMSQELKEVIADGIKALREKEQMVVSLYYYKGLTLKEIGEVMGLTESRISQIHTKAIIKLRTRLRTYSEM
jgi:RNA polymerase sigma factor for flagellar operon FliA